MTTKLADVLESPERANEIPTNAILPLLAQIAAIQSALAVRLLASTADRLDNGEHTVRGKQDALHLITVVEAAKMLAFKPAYLYELIRQGKLPAIRQGKYIRISVADLQRWIQQHQNKPLD